MKPIKGMNLDVSPDSQPPNTYRRARNWVYDDEFDGLLQQPGETTDSTLSAKHIIASHAFEDGDIVHLVTDASSATTGDAVVLYNHVAKTYSTILESGNLSFDRDTVYDLASFRNTQDERVIIITSNATRPLAINIDLASQPSSFGLQFLVPDRNYPTVQLSSLTPGTLSIGTHFVAVRYELEDGTKTTFGPPTGPFRLAETGNGLNLLLTQVDTNYKRLQLGLISLVDNAISTRVVADIPATQATSNVFVEGSSLEEILLEDIIVSPQSYVTAGSVEYHDNRVYLGNVTENTEDVTELQGFANQILPMWEVPLGAQSEASDTTNSDPSGGFMADEVYAFYVSWVREDGTRTRAYHIPGQPAKSQTVTPATDAGGSSLSYTARNVTITDTLSTILSQTDSGEANHQNLLGYLRNDRNIFESTEADFHNIKYFHTRGTATAVSDTDTMHQGSMGYWENANETYPADWPVGKQYLIAANGTVSSAADETLAGAKVRHHRIPSLSWMFENVSTFDFDSYQDHGFRVRFDFVRIPAGFKSVQIFHAKRTNQNNLVLSHTPLHFGSSNHWSRHGEGGSVYQYYSAVSPVNARNGNSVIHTTAGAAGSTIGISQRDEFDDAAGNPKQSSGLAFTQSGNSFQGYHSNDGDAWGDFATEYQDRLNVHYHKGFSYAQDLLSFKPALPAKLYTRFEYMLLQEEEVPQEQDGHPSSSGTSQGFNIMNIANSDSSNYFATAAEDSTNTGQNTHRRSIFDMTDSSGLGLVRSFAQSEVLPTRDARYIPAGVVDDEVNVDNRHSAEAVFWKYKFISNTITPYNETGYHNAGDRLWYSVLNNPDTYSSETSGDTDDSSYTTNGGTQFNRNGFWLAHMWSTGKVLGVQRLPFVNLTAMRFDCYSNFGIQDLVCCSDVIASSDLVNAPTIGGTSQATKTIVSGRVQGDVHFSKTQYRVTSATGFNMGVSEADANALVAALPPSVPSQSGSEAPLNTRALVDFTPTARDGTRNENVGTVNVLYKVNTVSPVDSLIHNQDKTQHIATDYDNLLRSTSAAETNQVDVNSNLMRLNDWFQPVVNEGDAIANSHRYRVARSASQETSTRTLDFRVFPPLEYHEQARNRGEITNLQSFGDKLLIHHRQALYLTVGKEAVATSAGQVVLGTGDIFRITPTELAPSEFGFAGTQHKESCTLTPHGYFFVDAEQRKAFLYNGKIQEISNRGMRSWFQENLDLRTDWFDAGSYGGVNSFYPGVKADYDPIHNRVMLVVRNNTKVGDNGTYPATLSAYEAATSEYTDKTEYLSYSFNNNAWVSFHDFRLSGFVSNHLKLFGFRTATNTTKVDLNSLANTSFGYNLVGATVQHATIDVAFPANQPVQWQSFSWHTKAVQHDPATANYLHVDLNKTFDKAAVYNDYQCSGERTFTRASQVDITNIQAVTLRHDGTRYQFNGFRDLVDDTAARFIDENGEFVTSNINASKNWYEQRRFKSTYAVLRLIAPRTTTNLLYLYDVDAKVRKAYR